MGCSHKIISGVDRERYPDTQRIGRLIQMMERGHEVK